MKIALTFLLAITSCLCHASDDFIEHEAYLKIDFRAVHSGDIQALNSTLTKHFVLTESSINYPEPNEYITKVVLPNSNKNINLFRPHETFIKFYNEISNLKNSYPQNYIYSTLHAPIITIEAAIDNERVSLEMRMNPTSNDKNTNAWLDRYKKLYSELYDHINKGLKNQRDSISNENY
jgi:hypothetical protein